MNPEPRKSIATESLRVATDEDRARRCPVYAVWEVTLACDQRCLHCGSRAGRRRGAELSLAECRTTIEELAALGTREITLMGGEVYLRPDWLDLIRAVSSAGIRCTLLTGGRAMTEAKLREARAAGLHGIGVSIDGTAALHDEMRGVPGSYETALSTLRSAAEVGLPSTVNTQVGPRTVPVLGELAEALAQAGALGWRIGWVLPIGNASDHPELVLQPFELAAVIPQLQSLFWHWLGRGPTVCVDDGIGYYGPGDHVLRGAGAEDMQWLGCTGGTTSIGLESEGRVKACTSLPTAEYAGPTIREASLLDTWREDPHVGALRGSRRAGLFGFCATCYFADVCRGGCTCSAHAVHGRRGDNPYCHHRVLELMRQGLRERIERISGSDGSPYRAGAHRVIVEHVDGSPVSKNIVAEDQTRLRDRNGLGDAAHEPPLELCRACDRFVWRGSTVCPHCDTSLAEAAADHLKAWGAIGDAQEELRKAFGSMLRGRDEPSG